MGGETGEDGVVFTSAYTVDLLEHAWGEPFFEDVD